MKYKSTLLIALCVLGGIFTSFESNANTYSENLKNAVKAFLIQKGDIQDGEGVKYNWDRLEVQDPENSLYENSWWDDFADRSKNYIYTYYGGRVELSINTACYGNFILKDIDDLDLVSIATEYITAIKIENCNTLRTINLRNSYNYEGVIFSNTEIDISNCPALENIDIYESELYNVNITNCTTLSRFSLSWSTLNNISIKGCPSLENFSSDNNIQINKIHIEGSSNLKSFELMKERYESSTNVGEINISNNQSTIFLFKAENIQMSAFPALPTSITQLTAIYNDSKIGGTVNLSQLSNLQLFDCSSSSLQKLPTLPTSLKVLIFSNSRLNGSADLNYLKELGFFYSYESQFQELPQLPSSLKILSYYRSGLSGSLDLSEVPNLKYLDCSDNRLTDLVNLPSTLEILRCINNDFTKLPALPLALKILICGGNKIQDLDLSVQKNLELLNCEYNRISEIKLHSTVSLVNDIQYQFNDYFPFNYDDTDSNFNPFTDTKSENNGVNNNNLLFSKLDKIYGIEKLNDYYYLFPQDYYYKENIIAGDVINLSAEKAIPDITFTWYDVTKVFHLWENTYLYNSENNYYIENGIYEGTITDVTSLVTDNGDGIFNTSGLERKILLCKMNIPSTSNSTYYLANITDGENLPVLQLQTQIDGGEFTNIQNNTITTLSSSSLNDEEPPIERSIVLRVMPVLQHATTNDHWEIDYWYTHENDIQHSGQIAAGTPFDFPWTPQKETSTDNYDGTFKITELRVYENGSLTPTKTYSYAFEPYTHSIYIGDYPYLQYEESINSAEDKDYKEIDNNITTTKDAGNKVYLRIKVLGRYIPPIIPSRMNPANSDQAWEIEYTTKNGTSLRSGPMAMDKPFYFNDGNPHQDPGEYPYSVTKLIIYQQNDNTVTRMMIDNPVNTGEYEFSANPYNHTIIINDTDEPGPGPGPGPGPEEPEPGPNPDRVAGIEISVSREVCPDEEFVLIPYELKYTDYPMQYTIHFSAEAKAAGFLDQLVSTPLPGKYLTITLPANVPAGIYKGTIKLTSQDPKQLINDCPFEIIVLTSTKILKQSESAGKNACEGDLFTLWVEAVGEELSYQWYKDGQPITGATHDTYEAALSAATKGTYFVEVTGLCGIERSEPEVVDGNALRILMKWDDVMYIDNTSGRYIAFQWYKNDMPVEKHGSSVYYTEAAGLSGTYYVKATTKDGTVEESCRKVFDVLVKSSTAQLYPNPVRRNETLTVRIDIDNFTKGKLDILDLGGRLVLSRQLTESTTSVYVDLPAGNYVAKIQAPDGRITSQILVVK